MTRRVVKNQHVVYSNRDTVNGLEFWWWFMKHLSNTGKQTAISGVGGTVIKPRLHALIYPGKPLVCLGKAAMFVVLSYLIYKIITTLYGVVHYVVEETIHNCG